MIKFGLKSLVINSDTYTAAQQSGIDLWEEVCEGITMVLLSPEELASCGCFTLLEDPKFARWVSVLGVDEVHLIYWWGKDLRPSFCRLGNIRARLPSRNSQQIPVVATTATLRVGEPMECVQRVLGLVPGQYRFIRRSNVRHDIQIIFREMHSAITGHSFPELDWILDEGENTVIFCKTIALGFRIVCYLWSKAAHLPNRNKRIRLYNSLNWPTYNSETLGFLNNNKESSITVATDTLSVGWDSQEQVLELQDWQGMERMLKEKQNP